MTQSLGMNDGILLISLLYSCIDLVCEWDSFNTCSRPIHKWLFVSYACVIAFRVTHLAGTRASTPAEPGREDQRVGAAGDFLLDMRHKTWLPRVLASMTWILTLPFFTLWTFLGSSWLWTVVKETPECMPTQTHLWFSVFWLALCYVWVAIHVALAVVAWVLERRVRRSEADLRQIEDGNGDVRSRWGEVSAISSYRSLQGNTDGGLTPSEILALPCSSAVQQDAEAECAECVECAICLNEFEAGDSVRHLPACGHTFHRSCIDLWLLRRADCPLCKRCVRQ